MTIQNKEFYIQMSENKALHFYLFLKEHFTEGENQIEGQNVRTDFTDKNGKLVARSYIVGDENAEIITLFRDDLGHNKINFLVEFGK